MRTRTSKIRSQSSESKVRGQSSAILFLVLLLACFFAASAALEFSRGFSTHGGVWILFFVALATIEFSRRYATRDSFPAHPAFQRRAKISRRYAAKKYVEPLFFKYLRVIFVLLRG